MPYHKQPNIEYPSFASVADEKRQQNGIYGHEPHKFEPPAFGPEPEFGNAIRRFEERQHKMTKIDDLKAKELYDQGLSDHKIAEVFDVESTTICTWRKKNNLPAHFKPPCKKQPAAVTQCLKCGVVYNQGSDHTCPDREDPEEKPEPVESTEAGEPKRQHIFEAVKQASEKIAEIFGEQVDVPDPCLEDYLDEIEALQAENVDLMIKNSELSGFIDGLKFAVRYGFGKL